MKEGDQFRVLVKRMREIQKRYFKERSPDLLKLSKDAKCLFILDKEVNENKPYHIPYSVSKAGLKKMITIWAKEVTKDNINIYYCFAPRMNTFLRKTIIPGLKESDFKNPEDVSKKIINNLSKTSSEDGNLIEIFY